MTIPPRFLDDIRGRLSLSDIIGKRTRLTRAGREFKGCCPFHNEKSPSFTVNDDKQFFHCFGCGAHGDVIGFVMRHDNLSFVEAVETLAAQAGMQMPKPSAQEIQKAEKARDLHTLMDAAAKWMEEQLYAPANREILKYVEDRGLNREIMGGFRIGYAPSDRQSLRNFLKTEKFTDEQMLEAGVLKKSDKSKEPYAFFRDRVMFPVTDRRGRIVAFGGRILPENLRPPEKGDYKPAKYINSSDTPLFDKSRTLYGQNFARQAARDGSQILVTEGYMDVIACHQAGFRGAVAPMGTALTEDQILMLWAMIPTEEKIPVLCFDGDNAGRGAAGRACERILPLLKPYHSARFAFMPDGEDPDSLVKSGGAGAFQSILDSSIPLFDFLWLSYTTGRNFDTPESKAGLSQSLENIIKTIADREVQKHYQRALQARIYETFFHNRNRGVGGNGASSGSGGGFAGGGAGGHAGGGGYSGGRSNNSAGNSYGLSSGNKNWGGKSAGNRGFPGAGQGPRPAPVKPRQSETSDIHEKVVIAAILNHPHVFESIEDAFGNYELKNPRWNKLRQGVVSALSEDITLDREALANHLKSQGLEKEMGDILNESVYVHAAFSRTTAEPENVAGNLLQWMREIETRDWKEIQKGWKSASNEGDEEKLKAMMELKAGEGQ